MPLQGVPFTFINYYTRPWALHPDQHHSSASARGTAAIPTTQRLWLPPSAWVIHVPLKIPMHSRCYHWRLYLTVSLSQTVSWLSLCASRVQDLKINLLCLLRYLHMTECKCIATNKCIMAHCIPKLTQSSPSASCSQAVLRQLMLLRWIRIQRLSRSWQ